MLRKKNTHKNIPKKKNFIVLFNIFNTHFSINFYFLLRQREIYDWDFGYDNWVTVCRERVFFNSQ